MSREGAKCWWNQDLPKHIAYLYSDYPGDWKEVTYHEILQKKIDRQNSNISMKRLPDLITKPAFIWVFYNDTWIYGGWWIYIKTLKEDYPLNFKDHLGYKQLIERIMNLYPCGILPFDFSTWASQFEKIYHRKRVRKKEALLKCYCQITNNKVINIIPIHG